MATQTNPKAMRGGHRSSATRLITEVKAELDKDDGGSLETLGVIHNKLTEKLSKIRELDEVIIETLENEEEIQAEAIAQDERAVEIELVIANLHALLKGHVPGCPGCAFKHLWGITCSHG